MPTAVKYLKIVGGVYSTANSTDDTISINAVAASASVTTPALDTATNVAMNIGTTNATTINIGRTGQTFNVKGDLVVDGVETLTGGTAFGSALILNEFAAATSGTTTQPSCDLRFKYSYYDTSAHSVYGYTQKVVPASAAAGVGDLQWLDANTTERMRLVAGAGAKLKVATIDALAAGALTLAPNGGTATSLSIGNNVSITNASTLTAAGLVTASNGFTMTTGAFAATANAASSLTTSAGALTITGAVASTWSTAAGALTLTSAAAATWKTSAGVLTLDGYGGLALQSKDITVASIDATPTALTMAANYNLTAASGTGAFNFSAASGLFKTTTGAVTIGSGAISITGATTFAANIGIATTAGTGAFDFSNGTGIFSTTTGTNTLNGAVVFAANKGVTVTAGTSAFDFSGGTGAFLTSTGAVTIGNGAVSVTGASTFSANSTFTKTGTATSGGNFPSYNLVFTGSEWSGSVANDKSWTMRYHASNIGTITGLGFFSPSFTTGAPSVKFVDDGSGAAGIQASRFDAPSNASALAIGTNAGVITITGSSVSAASAWTFSAAGTALTVNNNATITGVLTASSSAGIVTALATPDVEASGYGSIAASNTAVLALGTDAAKTGAVSISRSGQTTTVYGNLTVNGTFSGSVAASSAVIMTGTASTSGFVLGAAAVAAGSAVYISADSTVQKADNSASSTAYVIGFATSAVSTPGNAVAVQSVGCIVPVKAGSEVWTTSLGKPLYLATGADAGKVTITPPTTGILAQVGYVKDVANSVMLIAVKDPVDLGS